MYIKIFLYLNFKIYINHKHRSITK